MRRKRRGFASKLYGGDAVSLDHCQEEQESVWQLRQTRWTTKRRRYNQNQPSTLHDNFRPSLLPTPAIAPTYSNLPTTYSLSATHVNPIHQSNTHSFGNVSFHNPFRNNSNQQQTDDQQVMTGNRSSWLVRQQQVTFSPSAHNYPLIDWNWFDQFDSNWARDQPQYESELHRSTSPRSERRFEQELSCQCQSISTQTQSEVTCAGHATRTDQPCALGVNKASQTNPVNCLCSVNCQCSVNCLCSVNCFHDNKLKHNRSTSTDQNYKTVNLTASTQTSLLDKQTEPISTPVPTDIETNNVGFRERLSKLQAENDQLRKKLKFLEDSAEKVAAFHCDQGRDKLTLAQVVCVWQTETNLTTQFQGVSEKSDAELTVIDKEHLTNCAVDRTVTAAVPVVSETAPQANDSIQSTHPLLLIERKSMVKSARAAPRPSNSRVAPARFLRPNSQTFKTEAEIVRVIRKYTTDEQAIQLLIEFTKRFKKEINWSLRIGQHPKQMIRYLVILDSKLCHEDYAVRLCARKYISTELLHHAHWSTLTEIIARGAELLNTQIPSSLKIIRRRRVREMTAGASKGDILRVVTPQNDEEQLSNHELNGPMYKPDYYESTEASPVDSHIETSSKTQMTKADQGYLGRLVLDYGLCQQMCQRVLMGSRCRSLKQALEAVTREMDKRESSAKKLKRVAKDESGAVQDDANRCLMCQVRFDRRKAFIKCCSRLFYCWKCARKLIDKDHHKCPFCRTHFKKKQDVIFVKNN